MKRNIANIITYVRIACAILIVMVKWFTPTFWVLYLVGGLSDLVDGVVARRLKQTSEFGAKIDSIADAVFFVAIFIGLLRIQIVPKWIWIGISMIAMIRLITYGIGYCKFHTFTSLHTYANKMTGLLLFACPMFVSLFGFAFAGWILCFFAGYSAIEEIIIISRSKELDRDCKRLKWKNKRDNK